MTPLERAARAVDGLIGVGDQLCATPEEVARAVLTAIREPDEAMTEAGGEQVLDTEVGAGQYASIADGRGSKLMANNQAVNAWAAMIDAILAGGE